MTVSIRAAVPGDGTMLHDVAGRTFRLACPPGTTLADITEFVRSELSVDRFEDYLADPDRRLLVAEDSGGAVGYAMLVSGAPTDADVTAVVTERPAIELNKFYLLATAHGSGAATTLMTAAIDSARAAGASVLWLGVNQVNGRANRFYEKSGFAIVGTKQFALAGRFEDDFVRALVIGPR